MSRHLTDEEKRTLRTEITERLDQPSTAISERLRVEGVCFDCFAKEEIAVLIELLARDTALLAIGPDRRADMGLVGKVFDLLAQSITDALRQVGVRELTGEDPVH